MKSLKNTITWGRDSNPAKYVGYSRFPENFSGFDVARVKNGASDHQKRDVEAHQNTQRLAYFPPRNRLTKHKLPEVKMMREEKVLVLAKIWNFLEDRVHEKE